MNVDILCRCSLFYRALRDLGALALHVEGFLYFIMLENGATYGTQPTQVWAPYYTLHKILAGLMDIYEVSGNKKALEIAKGMGEIGRAHV